MGFGSYIPQLASRNTSPSSLLSLVNNVQLQSLSFLVSKSSLSSDIVTEFPFPSTEAQGLPPFLLLVMFRICGNLSKIVPEACRSQFPFSAQSQGLLFLLCYVACDAQDTQQSYQTELRTAELIGETYLPFASSLLSSLDCNGEGSAFIFLWLLISSCYITTSVLTLFPILHPHPNPEPAEECRVGIF